MLCYVQEKSRVADVIHPWQGLVLEFMIITSMQQLSLIPGHYMQDIHHHYEENFR